MKKNIGLLYIILTLIIISSGSLVQNKITTTAVELIICILSVLLLSKGFINKSQISRFLLFLYMILFFVFILFINTDNATNKRLLIIQFSMLVLINMIIIYCFNKKIKFLIIFSNIIEGISIYTLVLYFLISILKVNIPSHVIGYSNTPLTSYFDIYFTWQNVNWFNHYIPRNQSIFWEPGVYQIYLNFALIIEIFIKDKRSYKILVILCISIITTFSTSGIIFALALFYFKLLLTKTNIKIIKFIKVLIIPIILVLIFNTSNYVLNQKKYYATDSYENRSSNIVVSYEMFKEKPIFGWGYLNSEDFLLKQNSMLDYYWSGFAVYTNGLMAYLFQNGIFGLLIYGISLIFAFKYKNNKKVLIIFILFFIVSNSTEAVIQTDFMLMFLSYGYSLYIFNGKNISIE